MLIIIPGKPIAKKRPRFWSKGKASGVVNVQRTEEGEYLGKIEKQIEGFKPMAGPVKVFVWFGFPRPKSHYGTGKNTGILKQSAPKNLIKKPDLDNAVKFIFDVLNGLVWIDDCQIIQFLAAKEYTENPRTEITIEELK